MPPNNSPSPSEFPPLTPSDRTAALRILDANANRAAEGIRVLEDHARFALDDRHLASVGKQLRHELTSTLHLLPADELLTARDTAGDVGTALQVPQEYQRLGVAELLHANAQRAEQALRCLEEYSKFFPECRAAHRFEALRYQLYTWHRALAGSTSCAPLLQQARLYVLVDGGASESDFVARIEQLLHHGVHLLQLRAKALDDRTLLSRARLLRDLTRNSNTGFIMNDRPDLAVLAQADGVHVGQEELTVHDVRKIVGPKCWVGVSTHSLQQARQAVRDGADYIGCGPVFPSQTKQFEQFAGLEFLRQVAAEIRLPAFAIGGIDGTNLSAVLATGFTRVAVSGAVTGSARPGAAAESLLQQLLAAGPEA